VSALLQLHHLAGTGDAAAQARLVDALLCLSQTGLMDADEAATLAEPVAIIAASHGGSAERLTLVGVWFMRAATMDRIGRADRRDVYVSQAAGLAEQLVAEGYEPAASGLAAMLNQLADAGDESAAARLAALADKISPAALRGAASLQRLFGQPDEGDS
jgi:hypothetical protein